jgi:hypothetical protein
MGSTRHLFGAARCHLSRAALVATDTSATNPAGCFDNGGDRN